MRRGIKAGMIALSAAATLASGSALAAPAADGVFFVHGTGDYTPPASQANSPTTPTDGTAISGYWTLSSIQTMIKDPAGGNWTYGVAGYQGSSQNALNSASTVASQIEDFYRANHSVLNIVLITHSNGSNPVRYIMAHPTATNSRGTTYSTVMSWVKKVVFVAGDNAGTPLADKVTSSGSLANIANDLVSALGITNYNTPAVLQQVQSTMATYNGNGTFATGSTPGGITTNYVYGNNVYANLFSGDAWCGGYSLTVGLKATQVYGWGSSSAATDGFIGVNSSTYVGTAGMSGDGRLNHNQSRRSCHGSGGTIASLAHGALSGGFTAPPPDYTISPAAQACNETWAGWMTVPSSECIGSTCGGYEYSAGCSSAMQTDSNTDSMCQISYGADNGNTLPDNYSTSLYGNAANYGPNNAAGCKDSWLGDGICDLCLIAKYGYDGAPGSTGDGDCVNQGAGTRNTCYDIFKYNPYSQSLTGASNVYDWYYANH